MTNARWFSTDYVEEKCEEFVLLSEHKPEKAVRKIWPLLVWFLPVRPSDRHRGGGHPPTPATPPCVRVRTRRFEMVNG